MGVIKGMTDQQSEAYTKAYSNHRQAGKTELMSELLALQEVQKLGDCKGKKKKKKSGFMKWFAENTPVNDIKSITVQMNTPDEEAINKDDGEEVEIIIKADVIEKNEDKRLVYGWASVIEDGSGEIFDLHDDSIEVEALVKAAHDYVSEYRDAHEMHNGNTVGKTVESIVFTKEVQKALGIDLGKVGWFIGQKVDDDATWDKIKKGELKAFSIGGSAIREKV